VRVLLDECLPRRLKRDPEHLPIAKAGQAMFVSGRANNRLTND
jgi:hypothetical protein